MSSPPCSSPCAIVRSRPSRSGRRSRMRAPARARRSPLGPRRPGRPPSRLTIPAKPPPTSHRFSRAPLRRRSARRSRKPPRPRARFAWRRNRRWRSSIASTRRRWRRPPIWWRSRSSRPAARRRRRGRESGPASCAGRAGQAAAACAVMLMAGGVSWSLLRHGDLTGDGAPVPPARAPQAVGSPKVVEPAPAPVASPEPVGSHAAGCAGRLGIFDPIGVAGASCRPLVGATAGGSAGGACLRAGAGAAAFAAIADAGAHRALRAAQRRGIRFPSPLQGRGQSRQARAGPAAASRGSVGARSRLRRRCGRGRSGPGPCREAGRPDPQVGSQRTCGRHLGARLRARRPRQAPSRERAGALVWSVQLGPCPSP